MPIPQELEALALLGWRLTPATRSKKGLFAGYLDAATHDLEQIERWSSEYPGCNWKVVPSGSGIFAIDIDVPSKHHAADGVAAMRALVAEHGPLPPRPYGRSPNGGWLMVFRHDGEPIRSRSGTPAPGIDPRAGRNAFTVAPSYGYSWIVAPWDLSPPPAPSWLLTLLKPPEIEPRRPMPDLAKGEAARNYAVAALHHATRRLASVGSGARNDALNAETHSLARFVAAGIIGEDELRQCMMAAAQANGMIAQDGHRSAAATFASALKARR